MKTLIQRWGPAVLWAAVLFFASSRPTLPTGLGSGMDKVAHFFAYLVLGLLLARGAVRSGRAPLWGIVLGLLYAASDEYHQSFVPGRAVELADWVADALGVLTGTAVYLRWKGLPSRIRN